MTHGMAAKERISISFGVACGMDNTFCIAFNAFYGLFASTSITSSTREQSLSTPRDTFGRDYVSDIYTCLQATPIPLIYAQRFHYLLRPVARTGRYRTLPMVCRFPFSERRNGAHSSHAASSDQGVR